MLIELLLLLTHVSALQQLLDPLGEAEVILKSGATLIQGGKVAVEAPIILNSSKSLISAVKTELSTKDVSLLGSDAGNWCGLDHDVIKNYLTPPQAVKDFISFAFGVTFDIGLLEDSESDSCKTLGNMIGNVEMAWINVGKGKVTEIVTNTVDTKKANFKKCKDRGEDEAKCKKQEELDTPKASYAQKYIALPFPICMAIRPCDSNNVLFREVTFGIRFGGSGVPIFKLHAIDFNLIQLAFSSNGQLTTAHWDSELPPLLDLVPHTSWGMHVFLEAGASIPLCKLGGKDILTAEVNAGLGVLALMKLKNGEEIRSAAEFFGYFIEAGGDVEELSKKFVELGSSIKSVNFELNGFLKGKLSVNLNALFGTESLNDLSVQVAARSVTQLHMELGNTYLEFWNSFKAETNLKDPLAIAPILSECVPAIDLSILMQVYASVPESGDMEFIGAFSSELQLECGPLYEILKVWEILVDYIEKSNIHANCKPLYDMIDLVMDFLHAVCSAKLKLGFQIRVKSQQLVPTDTFIQFNDRKLRLVDLPICDPGVFGIAASPFPMEELHDHVDGRCSSHEDCYRNDGSYKIGIYDGNQGYCFNHPQLFTSDACMGRCIKKLPPGAVCDKDTMHIFILAQLDFTDAEHEACQSGHCSCGTCTFKNKTVPNGAHCVWNEDCASGWCEGHSSIGCNGVCQPRRKTGEPAFQDMYKKYWAESCETGRQQCGTCTKDWADLANGKYCSNYAHCASRWCEGDVVLGCYGKCQPRRENGVDAWKGWKGSCLSGKVQCGTCTANHEDLANGKYCSSWTQCASKWCEGDVVLGCNGKCQPRRKNGVDAWKGWSGSCLSGKAQCGTCTSNYEDIANGKYCSSWKQCASRWCEGDVVVGCHGKCQARRPNGVEAWKGWSGSCLSGNAQCGTCTSGSRGLGKGKYCSKDDHCRSGTCGCGGWLCMTAFCNGQCTAGVSIQ